MKTLIILSVFVLCAAVGQAQEVTKLEEVKIAFSPLNAKQTQHGDVYTLTIKESSPYQFVKNPIGFLNDNLEIRNLIVLMNEKNYDSFVITLKSSKGSMVANYDGEGNLLTTRQNFKNTYMPRHLRLQVYNANKGWTVLQNRYMASSKGIILTKAIYKLTLQNGNQKRHIKIDAIDKKVGAVASN